jgi:arabinogalactan oligomer/maltooligosaccharide transport system permease protein
LLPAVILGSIWTFNKFEVIYLVSEGRPDGATEILVTEAYKWAFERGAAQGGAYGYAAAYSVIIFVVLLLYGWMTSRVSKAAEEALR